MADRLVTIAAFNLPTQARLAENAIRAAGIRVTVGDESVVAMDWLLSNAVGGVKVQVWESDADRAVAVLEQDFGADGAGFSSVDAEEFAAEAEAAPSEGDEEPPGEAIAGTSTRVDYAPDTVADEEPEVPTEREQYALRAYRASLFGLIFPILQFYAVYLLLMTWSTEGALRPHARRRAAWATALTSFCLAAMWCWARLAYGGFY